MNKKKQAAIKAAQLIKDNMIVGLGTGTTAYYLLEELGRKIKEENLNITGVTTSNQTKKIALDFKIPIRDLNKVNNIDITIDGADEFDPQFNGIKGGGGALLYEKIVATYSTKYVWIVDNTKQVKQLGAFPLPIEVIPYGYEKLIQVLQTKKYNPRLRLENDHPFITDSGNYIIDCNLNSINHPQKLALELNNLVGVVEHGLFLNMVDQIIIGCENDLKILENTNKL